MRDFAVFLMALVALYSALPCCASPATAALRPLAGAERALLEGRADAAAATLHTVLATSPANATAHLLLCRVWLSEEHASEAADECRAALADGLGKDSAAQDWTGRALGRKAEHAGLLAGMKLAFQVRSAFETAVSLNPNSEAACVDLGEFYTSAPAIVGGGNTRALALASRIEPNLPAVSHRIRAMAAEKDKDLATAEREFNAEVAVAHAAGAMVDLAAFYARHHHDAQAIATARQILAADRVVDANVFEAAGVLDDTHQTDLAVAAMRSYLAHGVRSDAAPAFRVLTALAAIEARTGAKDRARTDLQQALALASQYGPAQKGLEAL